jgi:putative ABC transport system permease protein
MGLTLAGVTIGLAAAFGLTRLMKGLLFGVSSADPLVFMDVTLLLIAIAMLACWLPARRAAKIDPMGPLRCD